MNLEDPKRARRDGFSAAEGLLWKDGQIVELPAADAVARRYGFLYAERLVKALVKLQEAR